MTAMNTTSFLDELEKIAAVKEAVDPVTVGAFLAGAKATSLVTNVLRRHGMNVPLVGRAMKRIGAEALGLGARLGASGAPMVSRPVREAVALLEPSVVKAYEAGHAIGKTLGPQGLRQARAATKRVQQELAKKNPALAKDFKAYSDVIDKARLHPTKADLLFAPVGDTVQALKGAKPSAWSMRQALKAEQASGAHVRFPAEVIRSA